MSWIGEKLAFFRYPPYDAKNIGLIKALLKNRFVSKLSIRVHKIMIL